jgi:hypothetical protein
MIQYAHLFIVYNLDNSHLLTSTIRLASRDYRGAT